MSSLLDRDWKPIPNFNDYVISSAGCILSYKRGDWREIHPYIGKNGYKYVNLRMDGKTERRYIHRLVAQTFIPNPEFKPAVNHIDGDKLNNDVENLEWVTYQENSIHAVRNGLTSLPDSESAMKNHRTPVKATCLETGEQLYFDSQLEAAIELDITPPHINKVLKGQCPHAKGYLFEYLEVK